MRVDVLTIFPEYLAPLGLSLLGRAQAEGILTIRTHDLRDWTHDSHRTVDDTPYGGGAGMVMRPEPWGEAIDAVLVDPEAAGLVPTLVIPTPTGIRLDQRLAENLSLKPWLVVGLRPVRRHRPAGRRPLRRADGGARDQPRRLCARRWRGGSPGDHRGGRAPAARRPRQPGVTRPGVTWERIGRGAARVPGLHQAAELARAWRARGAAVRTSWPHRGLASRGVGTSDRAAPSRPGPSEPDADGCRSRDHRRGQAGAAG